MRIKKLSILIALVILPGMGMISALGQDKLPVPEKPASWVNDYADVLSASQEKALITKLGQFEYRTSTQIFIVTLEENFGYPADMLAPMIGERWGVGQGDEDNGIIILADIGERDVFIATGYGNEEYVTDLLAGRIVDNEILPNFRNDDYYTGFDEATTVLISLLDGKFTADEYKRQTSSSGGLSIGGFIFLMILLSLIFGGRRRSTGMGGRSNLPLWIALGMMSGGGRSHSGSWGSFSGGSGGGGFGGFSGGGGGGFGGGGAGGSW